MLNNKIQQNNPYLGIVLLDTSHTRWSHQSSNFPAVQVEDYHTLEFAE